MHEADLISLLLFDPMLALDQLFVEIKLYNSYRKSSHIWYFDITENTMKKDQSRELRWIIYLNDVRGCVSANTSRNNVVEICDF